MNAYRDESAADLSKVIPILDEAITRLKAESRTAIIMRYFEGRDFCSIGEALGITEDAARMRVSRALETLRDSIRHKNVEISVGILATVLGAAGSRAVPAAFAANLAAAALASAPFPTVSTLTLMKSKIIIGLAKTKVITGMVTAAMAIGLLWQHQKLQQSQTENTSLQRQLGEQAATPAQASPDALPPEEIKRLRDERPELMRLRGEYAQWQKQSGAAAAEIGRLKNEIAAARQEAALKAEGADQEAMRRNREAQNAEIVQVQACIKNLVAIGEAKEQWALEHKLVNGVVPQDNDIFGATLYIATKPVCPDGGVYTLNAIGADPTCSLAGHTVQRYRLHEASKTAP